MSREISLSGTQTVTVVTREEVLLDTDRISVDLIWDDGFSVKARISFFSSTGLSREIVLWEGQDYVNVGQWTDTDVDNRIKYLLGLS